jgi:hypothetical protein
MNILSLPLIWERRIFVFRWWLAERLLAASLAVIPTPGEYAVFDEPRWRTSGDGTPRPSHAPVRQTVIATDWARDMIYMNPDGTLRADAPIFCGPDGACLHGPIPKGPLPGIGLLTIGDHKYRWRRGAWQMVCSVNRKD